MSTNTPTEKGTPQSRTYTVNDIAAILGIGIRYNKLRKLKIAEKVDTACRSLVE